MKRTILVIDDSLTERVVLKGFMKAEYDVLEAASGEQGIEVLREHHRAVSAIVLDVIMPGIDGFETLKRIKQNEAWLPIPVIITTGLDDEDSREKAISCGADNFVTKPFNRTLLQHVLQNAIRLRETAEIANQLQRDSMTGLLNKDSFYTEASRMIKRQPDGYYMLSIFNVENFKIINDQYGADIGDEVMKHIANKLTAFASAHNGLACRYMGDKFAILYPAALMDTGEIKKCYREMTAPACLKRALRIRVGRYLVTDRTLPVSAMYDRASLAENAIKGRVDVYHAQYTESMREELLREQEIVNEMGGALDRGEFEPWFQPQYNHATGVLIGAEALVRWRKNGKIVPPYLFIPVFEKNGFIYEVDQSVWRQVCRHLRRWLDEGRNPMPVSVNISRYDLCQKGFLGVLSGLVKEYDLPADLLRLEITESAFSDNTNVITEMVGKLIERGFTVEIDDFGSGYSSLNTLKDVPASILKLDMRFFEKTKNSERGGNIVESVVRMAKWLGMAVIAEGVEDRAQADYLKTIGCYYIQGYYYAKPMDVESYEKKMAEGASEAKLSRLETLETLDSNLFWDPKSMETLIFNSYVGGACIFEYHDGKAELLRVNDQYISELHGLIPAGAHLGDASILPFLDEEERALLKRTLIEASEQKKEASCEVHLTDGARVEYVRVTARVIARTDERALYYAVIVNITEQREAERQRIESARQLQIILANINGSVSASVLDDVGNTKLIFGNDRYYEIFGYTKEQAEAVHLDTMSCIIPEDFDMVVGKLNRLRKDGVPVNIDYRAQKRDGSLIYVRCIASRMSMEGYGDEVIVSVETDITEQRTLQDQLSAIVDNINGGVSATYLKGDAPAYVIVNDKYFELIGYTKEQFAAEVQNVFDLVHPDDRARVEKLFRAAARDQKPYTMEYRMIRRNGAIRHILCNANVLHLFGIEEPVQLAVSNDITVLRETQRKEQDLAIQMRTIMENIRGGVTATVFHDADDVEIVFANDGFYELYGYTKDQFESELPNMLDLILPTDRAATMETVARIVRERSCDTYEYRCKKRDGSVMWTQVTNAVISLAGVGDTVLLGIVTDVTALRLAELRNVETMNRLQTVLNAMASGITAVVARDDHTEFLFANDRYYAMHGISREEYERKALRASLAMVHPDDRALMRDLVLNTTEIGETREAEYRILRPDGAVRWTKVVVSVTNLTGVDAPVQVSVFTDINAEKEAAQQLRFLNDSARDILAQPDAEVAINATLARINEYFGADRSYVVEMDGASRRTNNTYEVCAGGVRSERANLQGLPYAPDDAWFKAISEREYMIVEDVNALDDSQAKLRDMLRAQDIRSIIIVALKSDGRLLGFAGSDNPSNALGQVPRLTAVADYLAVLLQRRDLIRRIERERETVRHLMDDAPGGFCRMRIEPGAAPTLVNMNEGFRRMLGMTAAEATAAYGEDLCKCLAMDDVAAASANAGQFSTQCRLRRADGGSLWVMMFGRFVKGDDGETCLNAYFTDITERKNAEQHQIELLDNLPSGAALYEYDGKNIKAIHINSRYWELVGRAPADNAKISVFDAIHPDDRAIVGQEIDSAIRQRRNADVNVRIRRGDGGYRPLNIAARITPRDDGHYTLYVAYTPISDEAMSIQEMLPIALSTMVASADDMSYVKDVDLRYICVSQSIADMAGVKNPRDFVGKAAGEVFDAVFSEKFDEDDRRVIETGKAVLRALEHIPMADGRVCLIRTSKFPILDASGRAVGVYSVSHDITAQKEKESQLELLTSSIPGGLAVYSLSQDGITTLYFNDGYFAFSGYTRAEYTALTDAEPLALMLEADKPKMLQVVRTFAERKEDGMTGSCVYRVRTKGGGIRWMSMKAILSQVGEDAYIINVVQLDVTEQVEAENRRSQLLDNLPFGAALYAFAASPTKQGAPEAKLIYFNDGYCALLGYAREDYLRRPTAPLQSVFDEDRPMLDKQIALLVRDGAPIDCVFRVHTKGGGFKWVNCRATAIAYARESVTVNAMLVDVTRMRTEQERLRLAEEEYRLATLHAGCTICRYHIAERTLTMSADTAARVGLPETIEDVPYGVVRRGRISEETKQAYTDFYKGIMGGAKASSVSFCCLLNKRWRWLDAKATTIFDLSGKPASAIISYIDVTEQREKEAIYSRWQNSIAERSKDSYTLFRCNLSKSSSYESWEGDLLKLYFKEGKQTFDERTDEFIAQCVYAEDRARYRAFMRADTMLAEYYRGHRADAIEFRQQLENGRLRWLRLSVDLVEYPDSNDVEAYLMYENIDEKKRAELKTIERAQTDPLTGVLNRSTFAVRVNQIISQSKPGARHALMMLDVDRFKQVNDIFGHGAGDQALTDIADLLTRAARKADIVGRLGGDEFLMFLTDIPDEAVAAKRARQLCALIRKDFSVDVRISASIGVAMYPRDGEGFEALYKAADGLLYRVKDSGKNGYAFSHEALVLDMDSPRYEAETAGALAETRSLRRILIVDDNKLDLEYLAGLFKGEFRIEKATDGATAIAKLRHYGTAISAVLLDLMMPGMDGFEVLRKMQQEDAIQTIPVIVVSADEQRETALRVIRAGASDLVGKPVDPEVLRIRVESAISRSENERLRTQNSYLSMRNSEVNSYKSALDRSGILVITLDWSRNQFFYSPSVSAHLAGEYDGKVFWRVLLSEMVTDTETVRQMQQLVHDIAEDRERTEGSMVVRLKTAAGTPRLFDMNVFKEMCDSGLAEKIILTLRAMTPAYREDA